MASYMNPTFQPGILCLLLSKSNFSEWKQQFLALAQTMQCLEYFETQVNRKHKSCDPAKLLLAYLLITMHISPGLKYLIQLIDDSNELNPNDLFQWIRNHFQNVPLEKLVKESHKILQMKKEQNESLREFILKLDGKIVEYNNMVESVRQAQPSTYASSASSSSSSVSVSHLCILQMFSDL